MKTLKDYKNDIERELMVKVILGLRHGNITKEKAQDIATEYLKLRESTDIEQLFSNMSRLFNEYSEVLEVYLKTASKYFSDKTNLLLFEGRKYMNLRQYDLAVDALKGKVAENG